MLQDLLLVINMLICVALIGVVLMQRSEGGAFGTGGPTGLVTARGAGDLLTRTTWVLFTLFLVLSLALTLWGGHERSSAAILQRLKNTSINPEQIARPATPAPTPPPGFPTAAPSQAPPPALTLPPVAATPRPRPARHAAAPHKSAPASAPLNLGAPAPLSLPPITSPSETPAPSPQ